MIMKHSCHFSSAAQMALRKSLGKLPKDQSSVEDSQHLLKELESLDEDKPVM